MIFLAEGLMAVSIALLVAYCINILIETKDLFYALVALATISLYLTSMSYLIQCQ